MVVLEMGVDELEHGRRVLLRVIKNLSNEQLDFLVLPDSKSIGEILLHVAGFEFLMISAERLVTKDKSDLSLWHKLKSGFSREGGFAAPKGYALGYYLELLAEIRERTVAYFGEQAERRLVAKDTFPIITLAMLLRDNDPGADAQQYEKLATAVGTTFSDDGAANKKGETDLIHLVQLHETYHRGHITFQKYIYTRLDGSNGLGPQLRNQGHQ